MRLDGGRVLARALGYSENMPLLRLVWARARRADRRRADEVHQVLIAEGFLMNHFELLV